MKKSHNITLIICLSLVYCSNSWAQSISQPNLPFVDYQSFNLGFGFSCNRTNYIYKATDPTYLLEAIPNNGNGYNIHGTSRIGKNLDIRISPGIWFGYRNISITDTKNQDSLLIEFSSNMINIPVTLKYRFERLGNFSTYIVSGLIPTLEPHIEDWKIRSSLVNLFGLTSEIGIGFSIYLPKVKFSTELRYSYGLINSHNSLWHPEEFELYNQGILELHNSDWTLSVIIE